MDIIKVFGTNVKRYRQATGLSQEAFAENVVCTAPILAQLNAFVEVFRLRISNGLQMLLELMIWRLANGFTFSVSCGG